MPPKPRKHRRKRKATRELSSEQKRAKQARWRRNEPQRVLASWGESGPSSDFHDLVLQIERDEDGTKRRLTAISEVSKRLLDSQGEERSRLTKDLRRLLRRVRPPLRAEAEREQKKIY